MLFVKMALAASVIAVSATSQAAPGATTYSCHGRDHNRQPTRVSLVVQGDQLVMNGDLAVRASGAVAGLQPNQVQYNFVKGSANGYLVAYAVRLSRELVEGGEMGYANQQFVGERYLPGDFACIRN
jgi:hypothetical protein